MQLHSKKRNRLAQNHLNDIVFIKYNRALRHQCNFQDINHRISLDEINKSNEWLVEENDDLPWDDVAVVGVAESVYQSRESTSKTANTASCSSASIDVEIDGNETEEEEDLDNYKVDDDDGKAENESLFSDNEF